MIAAFLRRQVARLELEDGGVEIGEPLRLAGADGEMAERGFLLPVALVPITFGIDLRAVLVAGLRQVEIIAGWIVGAVAGERPVAGPLDDLDVGIFFRDFAADLVEVFHFNAEMIEAGLAAAAPRTEGHDDIAVADRDGADLARGVAGSL